MAADPADAYATYTGTDFFEFGDDGRIARLAMFYDSTAGLILGRRPAAYRLGVADP